jgi:hypothetical protein
MTQPTLRQFIMAVMLFFVGAAVWPCQSQSLTTMQGVVVDDSTGAPLENVNVFIAQSTFGCNTSLHGAFEIKNIPQGAYDIVASRLGYDVYTVRSLLSTEILTLKIKLKPATIPLGEVTISAGIPEQWEKQVERFRKIFLGSSSYAKECRILNPEVLDFDEEGDDYFAATAHAPLEIVNDPLGYHITFVLTAFHTRSALMAFGGSTGKGIELVYDGFPKYIELVSETQEMRDLWKKNRRKAYEGSQSHFLTSLFKDRWEDDGFIINLMPEPDRRNTRKNRTEITPENINDILSPGDSSGRKKLHYKGALEIEYTSGYLPRDADVLRKEGTHSPVSWLLLNREEITFNAAGLVMESMPVITYGYWAWQRFCDRLPSDYVPE